MAEFRMPMLGADMEAGTLVEWLKQPGDEVRRGDIIAVVDTQKGAIEIEVFEDGVIRELVVAPGTQVPVGTVLAVIDAAASAPAPRVEAPAAVPGPAPAASDRLASMRAAIAAAMARSKREIPHFYLSTTMDLTRAMTWLAAENARRPVTERLLPVVLLLKATARALGDVPELNGHWVDGAFRPGAGVHLGCAIAVRSGGLVAPTVHDVDRRPLGALMADLRDLVARVRTGSLRSSDLADATMTVTSLGDTGVDATFGVIVPPQVALAGFGRVARRPWAAGDAVEVRPQVTATLSADHRVVDGHRGGLFLAALDRHLQSPEAL